MKLLKNKKLLTITAVFICLFSIITYMYFTQPGNKIKIQGSIIGYNNVNEMEDYADLVIIGKTEKDFSELNSTVLYTDRGTIQDYCTVTDIKVMKVLKGITKVDSIPVRQRAAWIKNPFKYNKDLMIFNNYSVMEKEKKYLLFLKKVEDGNYSILSCYLGKFNIDDSDINEKDITEKDNYYKKLKENVLLSFKDKLN